MRVELVKTTNGRLIRREFAENERERRILTRRAVARTEAGFGGMWEDRDAGDISEDMVDDFSDADAPGRRRSCRRRRRKCRRRR